MQKNIVLSIILSSLILNAWSITFRKHDISLVTHVINNFRFPKGHPKTKLNSISLIEFHVIYEDISKGNIEIDFIWHGSKETNPLEHFYVDMEKIEYGDHKILKLYCSMNQNVKDSYLSYLPRDERYLMRRS